VPEPAHDLPQQVAELSQLGAGNRFHLIKVIP
jgi:hypothetical protein